VRGIMEITIEPRRPSIGKSFTAARHIEAKYYFTGVPCKNGHVSNRYAANGECWECRQEWRKRNREKTNIKQNVDRAAKRKEGANEPIRKENRRSLSLRYRRSVVKFNRENNTKFTSFVTYIHIIPVSDDPVPGEHGELLVKCYKCGKHFPPTSVQASGRAAAFKGKKEGDANFYCSDECQNMCLVYRFRTNNIDPRSLLYVKKTERQKVRDCQTDHLKQIQCDELGHNHCERCGDIIDVELHHTQTVSKAGKGAISSAGHMLLCAGCHLDVHEKC
jgi:hypothetical protein